MWLRFTEIESAFAVPVSRSGSQPCSRSRLATSVNPSWQANTRGVEPLSSAIFGSALDWSKRSTASAKFCHAKCFGYCFNALIQYQYYSRHRRLVQTTTKNIPLAWQDITLMRPFAIAYLCQLHFASKGTRFRNFQIEQRHGVQCSCVVGRICKVKMMSNIRLMHWNTHKIHLYT